MTLEVPKEDKETVEKFASLINAINKEIIEKTGGALGEVNKGTLDFAIWRALVARKKEKIAEEKNLSAAASLMSYIAELHPFKDGNKRTAYISAKLVLLLDTRYLLYLKIPYSEAVRFIIKIAQKKYTENQIQEWIKKHSIPKSEINSKTTKEIKGFIEAITEIAARTKR